MRRNWKKVLSLLLALTMVFSVNTGVLAEQNPGSEAAPEMSYVPETAAAEPAAEAEEASAAGEAAAVTEAEETAAEAGTLAETEAVPAALTEETAGGEIDPVGGAETPAGWNVTGTGWSYDSGKRLLTVENESVNIALTNPESAVSFNVIIVGEAAGPTVTASDNMYVYALWETGNMIPADGDFRTKGQRFEFRYTYTDKNGNKYERKKSVLMKVEKGRIEFPEKRGVIVKDENWNWPGDSPKGVTLYPVCEGVGRDITENDYRNMTITLDDAKRVWNVEDGMELLPPDENGVVDLSFVTAVSENVTIEDLTQCGRYIIEKIVPDSSGHGYERVYLKTVTGNMTAFHSLLDFSEKPENRDVIIQKKEGGYELLSLPPRAPENSQDRITYHDLTVNYEDNGTATLTVTNPSNDEVYGIAQGEGLDGCDRDVWGRPVLSQNKTEPGTAVFTVNTDETRVYYLVSKRREANKFDSFYEDVYPSAEAEDYTSAVVYAPAPDKNTLQAPKIKAGTFTDDEGVTTDRLFLEYGADHFEPDDNTAIRYLLVRSDSLKNVSDSESAVLGLPYWKDEELSNELWSLLVPGGSAANKGKFTMDDIAWPATSALVYSSSGIVMEPLQEHVKYQLFAACFDNINEKIWSRAVNVGELTAGSLTKKDSGIQAIVWDNPESQIHPGSGDRDWEIRKGDSLQYADFGYMLFEKRDDGSWKWLGNPNSGILDGNVDGIRYNVYLNNIKLGTLSKNKAGISLNETGTVKIEMIADDVYLKDDGYNPPVVREQYFELTVVSEPETMELTAKVAGVPYGYIESKTYFVSHHFRPRYFMTLKADGREITYNKDVCWKVGVSSDSLVRWSYINDRVDQDKEGPEQAACYEALKGLRVGEVLYFQAEYMGKTVLSDPIKVTKQEIRVIGSDLLPISAGKVPETYEGKLFVGYVDQGGDVLFEDPSAGDHGWHHYPKDRDGNVQARVYDMTKYLSVSSLSVAEESQKDVKAQADKAQEYRGNLRLTGMAIKNSLSENFFLGTHKGNALCYLDYLSVDGWESYVGGYMQAMKQVRVYSSDYGVNKLVKSAADPSGELSVTSKELFNKDSIPAWKEETGWKAQVRFRSGGAVAYDTYDLLKNDKGQETGYITTTDSGATFKLKLDSIMKDIAGDIYDIFVSWTEHEPEQKYEEDTDYGFVMEPVNAVKYNGTAHVASDAPVKKGETGDLKIRVKSNKLGKTLVYGTDYTVTYTNNKAMASAASDKAPKVTVTGKGEYSGLLFEEYFSIDKADMKEMYLSGELAETGVKSFYKNADKGIVVAPVLNMSGTVKQNVNYDFTFEAGEGVAQAEQDSANPKKVKVTLSDENKGGIVKLVVKAKDDAQLFEAGTGFEKEFYVLPKTKTAGFKASAKSGTKLSIAYSDKKSVTAADFAALIQVKGTGSAANTTLEAGSGYEALLCTKQDINTAVEKAEDTGSYYLAVTPTEAAVTGKLNGVDYCFENQTRFLAVTFAGNKFGSNEKFKLDDQSKNFETKAGEAGKNHAVTLKVPVLAYDGALITCYDVTGKNVAHTEKVTGPVSAAKDLVLSYPNATPGTYKIVITGRGGYLGSSRQTLSYKVKPMQAKTSGQANFKVYVLKNSTDWTAVKIPFNAGGYVASDRTDEFGRVYLGLGYADKTVPDEYLTNSVLKNAKVTIKATAVGDGKASITISKLADSSGKTVISGTISTKADVEEADLAGSSIQVEDGGMTRANAAKAEKVVLLYQKCAAKGADENGDLKTVKLTNKTHYKANYKADDFKTAGAGKQIEFSGEEGTKKLFKGKKSYTFPVAENSTTTGKFNATATKTTYDYTGRAVYPTLKITSGAEKSEFYAVVSGNGGYGLYKDENGRTPLSDAELKGLGYTIEVKCRNHYCVGSRAEAEVRLIPAEGTADHSFTYAGSIRAKFKIVKKDRTK